MMDSSRQEYPAMLASLQPSQAVAVLSDRIRQVDKVNKDIANWLSVCSLYLNSIAWSDAYATPRREGVSRNNMSKDFENWPA